MVRYSDAEIGQLLQEPKILPSDLDRRMQKLRPKRGRRELKVDLTGAQGSHFRLIIRQGTLYPGPLKGVDGR